MGMLLVIQALFITAKDPIIRCFTRDEDVFALSEKCFYIIVLAFIPDMIQGSMQGVIRALDQQRRASYIALAAFYLVSIPLAVLLVFVVEMGVAGLWIAMCAGIAIQAIFYTRLVVCGTDWQAVANDAQDRIAAEQAAMINGSFESIKSMSNRSIMGNSHDTSNYSFMRARD